MNVNVPLYVPPPSSRSVPVVTLTAPLPFSVGWMKARPALTERLITPGELFWRSCPVP